MAKVLGIAGSPRKAGNSNALLEKFLEGAESSGALTEKVYICGLKISPCDGDNHCHKTGTCRIKDDMGMLYSKLLSADRLVIASPVFFMGLPAQLKAMIDRCQSVWAKSFILKEPLRENNGKRFGYWLGVSGLNKPEAFTGGRATIKAFFHVLGFRYERELLFGGVDAKGDMAQRRGALEAAYGLGKIKATS